jgi:hypothetical protein
VRFLDLETEILNKGPPRDFVQMWQTRSDLERGFHGCRPCEIELAVDAIAPHMPIIVSSRSGAGERGA